MRALLQSNKPSSFRTKCRISQRRTLPPTHLEQVLLMQLRRQDLGRLLGVEQCWRLCSAAAHRDQTQRASAALLISSNGLSLRMEAGLRARDEPCVATSLIRAVQVGVPIDIVVRGVVGARSLVRHIEHKQPPDLTASREPSRRQ